MDETKKQEAAAMTQPDEARPAESTPAAETAPSAEKRAEPEAAAAAAAPPRPPPPPAAEAPAAAAPVPAVTVAEAEDVPDPDEDDLDDLDDLLDDFSAAKIDSAAPAAAKAASAPPAAAAAAALPLGDDADANLDALLNDDDFAKQLQAGMADLLGEIDKSPDVQAQFESLFKEFGIVPPTEGGAAEDAGGGPAAGVAAAAAAATGAAAAAHVAAKAPTSAPSAGPSSASAGAGGAGSAAADASFQDTIRRTMERMQASGDQATAAAAADSESADDLLSEFMKQMQAGGAGGAGGAGNEEELSKMLVGMMEELTNKEILYEPMKELHDKFPAWLAAHQDTTGADDLRRYREQQAVVRDIVARFEAPSYSDANPEDREYIVDRMQKMQAAGSPPPDLVGDMPSTQDALAVPDETCNPQ